jgi:hypothetical protein
MRSEMGAEVELMFGTAIKKAMILKDSLFEVVILWDMFKTQIYLEYTNYFKVEIRRVIFFLVHPQFFFFRYDTPRSLKIDSTLNIGADMVCIQRSEKQEECFAWHRQYMPKRFCCHLFLSSFCSLAYICERREQNCGTNLR